MNRDAHLAVEHLEVRFPTPRGELHAVRGVSFEVGRGEMFGIVGESGCGKTATGRAVMKLVPRPGRIAAGRILYHGEDLAPKGESEMRGLRGRRIGMVFQDPSEALNPLFTVGRQLERIMRRHRIAAGGAARERAQRLLHDLGLPHPADILRRYPHQLSGGMQQRVMLATALCAEPDLIIADEPTAALDVTIQSQILDLLLSLREERALTIVLISHDLGLVAETCERVAVFYLGRIVEEGAASDIFARPRHPYTQGLLAALPERQAFGETLHVIPGSVDTLIGERPGCAFAPRCEHAMTVCASVDPAPIPVGPTQRSACHLHRETGVRPS